MLSKARFIGETIVLVGGSTRRRFRKCQRRVGKVDVSQEIATKSQDKTPPSQRKTPPVQKKWSASQEKTPPIREK